MTPRMPGVSYARAENGLELPIIDLTHPSFALGGDPELAAAHASYIRQVKLRSRLPAFVRAALARFVTKRSLLLQAAFGNQTNAGGGFLSGTATYLLKLPPEHLAFAGALDRKLSATFVGLRYRLRTTARLIAEALGRSLAGTTPHVLLVNIGGGPAMDSLNALIPLRRELANRRIEIQVLDQDAAGASFGERAVAALRAPGAALAGLDAALCHVPYHWSEVETLRELLERRAAREAIFVASSEGALFDYGSHDDIAANLRVLHAGSPADAAVVGTITRDDEATRLTLEETKLGVRPIAVPAFELLAGAAGWRLDRVVDHPAAHVFRLLKRV
jgi:hypothetical protein